MALQLPDIEFKRSNKNPTVDSDIANYIIPFYKTNEYFFSIDNLVNFVKAVESAVRKSRKYSRYIKYLKEEIGLNFCQVTSNIKDDSAEIEMHHGPILTLFDCVMIVVEHLLNKGERFTTFSVADIILDEHYENHIQVVMLSKTVHEEVHEKNIFLNYKHAFGEINKFLEKYKTGINEDIMNKFNNYVEFCKKNESFDKGVLDLKYAVYNWSLNNWR